MFKDDFIWGVACSAYQYEGRDPQDGAGECMWDTFCKSGRVYEQQNAEVTCDGIHRYPEDFRLMDFWELRHIVFPSVGAEFFQMVREK